MSYLAIFILGCGCDVKNFGPAMLVYPKIRSQRTEDGVSFRLRRSNRKTTFRASVSSFVAPGAPGMPVYLEIFFEVIVGRHAFYICWAVNEK